jgi:hypothetical protein
MDPLASAAASSSGFAVPVSVGAAMAIAAVAVIAFVAVAVAWEARRAIRQLAAPRGRATSEKSQTTQPLQPSIR